VGAVDPVPRDVSEGDTDTHAKRDVTAVVRELPEADRQSRVHLAVVPGSRGLFRERVESVESLQQALRRWELDQVRRNKTLRRRVVFPAPTIFCLSLGECC
jgi:hypothetical protein